MSRETLIIILGVFAALAPFIGLPYPYLMVLLPVLGLVIAGSAFVLRLRRKATEAPHEERTA